jgi:hypothetical protein
MRNLLLISLILGGSLLAAQQQNDILSESEAAQKHNNLFEENDQAEEVTSQRGPGTNNDDGDLEDAEPVPIDKHSGWLFILAIAIIIYYTIKREKPFGKS